jgi:hypothetical protein
VTDLQLDGAVDGCVIRVLRQVSGGFEGFVFFVLGFEVEVFERASLAACSVGTVEIRNGQEMDDSATSGLVALTGSATTQFKRGSSGGPGRPKGLRNRGATSA